MSNIADLRQEYSKQTLNEQDLHPDAIGQFGRWWQEALQSEVAEPNAMTLATASASGKPSARIVLLKGYDESGFVFFTNYKSNKGRQMADNPQVCLVFFWRELERQVKIEGTVTMVPAEESDAYFFSRPEGSRIGAWASPQSQVISGRAVLEENVTELEKSFAGKMIDRPAFWGGYLVKPVLVEFWQGRSSRLHDRFQYSLQVDGWKIERLAP